MRMRYVSVVYSILNVEKYENIKYFAWRSCQAHDFVEVDFSIIRPIGVCQNATGFIYKYMIMVVYLNSQK